MQSRFMLGQTGHLSIVTVEREKEHEKILYQNEKSPKIRSATELAQSRIGFFFRLIFKNSLY